MTFHGSSPLTRGKLAKANLSVDHDRLIPAHAGKTATPQPTWHAGSAHPRSRGENHVPQYDQRLLTGSSPLTRGKPSKSLKQPSRPLAHPRSRGENDAGVHEAVDDCGSSPLTRGKHFLTCAFIAQIDQILESLELCASSGSYSLMDAYATDAPQDRVRSIGLAPLSSRGAS